MEHGIAGAADPGVQVRIALDLWTRHALALDIAGDRRLAEHLPQGPDAIAHGAAVAFGRQVVGVDARRREGIVRSQPQPPAALRHGHMHAGIEAVAAVRPRFREGQVGHGLHGGNEIELDVGRRQFRPRADEAAALQGEFGPEAAPPQQGVDGMPGGAIEPQLVIDADRRVAGVLQPCDQVIVQVLADPRQVVDHRHADLMEMVGRADARQQQQLGRGDRAAGQHDFARRADLAHPALAAIVQTDRLAPFYGHPRRMTAGAHRQVGPLHCRLEKGLRRGPAPAVADREMVAAETLALRLVEILRHRIARLGACFDQRIVERRRRPAAADGERPAPAVMVRVRPLEILRPGEKGQDIVIGPARAAHLAPAVIVEPVAAGVDHAVDLVRSAQHLAARPVQPAAVQARLRLGDIVPVVVALAEQDAGEHRHLVERHPVPPAGLQHQHADGRVFGQSGAQHAACAARADDDIVEFLGHRRDRERRPSLSRGPVGVRCRRKCRDGGSGNRASRSTGPRRRWRGRRQLDPPK